MPYPTAKQRLANFCKDFDICVISGGSSGIGAAFLKTLAQANPYMSAVNLSRRQANDFGFKSFKNIECDLTCIKSAETALAELGKILDELDKPKILLINNAGVGEYGRFCEAEKDRVLNIVAVNSVAPLLLTKALCGRIIQGKGAVLNVCSTAAFQPTPFMAAYGASKAFVLNWSIALAAEMSDSGCTVSALCPGPADTEFFAKAGFNLEILPDTISVSVEKVAEYGLMLLAKKQVYGIAGKRNRILIFLSKLVPLSISGKLAKFVLQRSLKQANDKAKRL